VRHWSCTRETSQHPPAARFFVVSRDMLDHSFPVKSAHRQSRVDEEVRIPGLFSLPGGTLPANAGTGPHTIRRLTTFGAG